MNDLWNKHIFLYIVAFAIAFIIALLTVPLSKKVAYKLGAIAIPNKRSMHKKPMPLAGGISIILGFIAAMTVSMLVYDGFDYHKTVGYIIGAVIISCVGILDDIYNLSAKIKIIFQILAALVVVYTGTCVEVVRVPWNNETYLFLGQWGKVLTTIWIVGVINAINFIDGLDGLAAGISAIASLCLMAIAVLTNNPPVVVMTAAMSGACLGFLPMNFNPAKIFMGDTGSTFLGFSLAVISIQGMFKSYTAFAALAAVFVLGLPVFDTVFAVLRRIKNKKPLYVADRGHLHHRLVDRGYSQKRAVLTLYAVSGCFGLAGILYAMDDVILSVGVLAIMVVVWIIDHTLIKRRKHIDTENTDDVK